MIYKNGFVFINREFVKADIYTKKGIITEIKTCATDEEETEKFLSEFRFPKQPPENVSCEDEKTVDCTGSMIIPGLVDIHTHGCDGYDFSTASSSEIADMAAFYYKAGVHTVLATTMTNRPEVLLTAADSIRTYCKDSGHDCEHHEARIPGIYMEGPFFGTSGKGAHDSRYLTGLDDGFLSAFDDVCGGMVRVVAFDPCLDGADEFVKTNKEKYVLSMAHTACGYERACEMIDKGVKHVTHIFNAMEGLDKRAPGIPGAVLDRKDVFAEMICDGIHIHPAVIRMMFAAHGDHIVLISDSMAATGLDDGEYELGGQKVIVNNGCARLTNGTIAGSVRTLYEMLSNVVSFGIDICKAVAAATINPALSVGLDGVCGVIAEGRKADFLVL